MRADLAATTAVTRHPIEAEAIRTQLNAPSVSDISWSYEAWTTIDGAYHLGNDLKGIDRFVHGAAQHGLELIGTLSANRKKSARATLDTVALAQDPTRCPHELWSLPLKPTDRLSLWLWRPTYVAAPGWNEVVVLGGVTDGTRSLLRLLGDDNHPDYPVLLEQKAPQGGWHQKRPDASGRVDTFGPALQATLGSWARSGALVASSPTAAKNILKTGVRVLTDAECGAVAQSFVGGHITGSDGMANLLNQMTSDLGMRIAVGPGAPQVPSSDAAPSVWTKRIAQGRHWPWGTGLAPADLAGYVALKTAYAGPRSGSAADVFSALFNTTNQNNEAVAARLIQELAMGLDPAAALMAAHGGSGAPPTAPGVTPTSGVRPRHP